MQCLERGPSNPRRLRECCEAGDDVVEHEATMRAPRSDDGSRSSPPPWSGMVGTSL